MKNLKDSLKFMGSQPNSDRFAIAARKEKQLFQACMDEIHETEAA